MKIVIGATAESWMKVLTDVLSQADIDVSQYAQSEKSLSEDALLLMYSRPEYAIEEAITAGGDIQSAIESWNREAGEMLKLFRHNRKRVHIIHGPSVFDRWDEFYDFVHKTFGMAKPAVDVHTIDLPDSDNEMARVLAKQTAASSLELTDLAGELEASSVLVGQDPPRYTVDWENAYDEFRTLESQANDQENRNEQNIKEIEEENELLLLQLHQVQEELEAYYLEAKDLREQRGGASSMYLDELLTYTVKLEHEYTKLLKSRTWKVMAPVREVSRLVKSLVRGKRVPRNRLPKRPGVMSDEPVGGRYGKRTIV